MNATFVLRHPPGATEDGSAKEPVPYVNIEIPPVTGQLNRDVVSRPATDDDKSRFSQEWEKFQEALDKGEVTAAPPEESTLIPSPPAPLTVQVQITPEMVAAVQAQEKQRLEEEQARTESIDTARETTEAPPAGTPPEETTGTTEVVR